MDDVFVSGEPAMANSGTVLRIATYNVENYHDNPALQGGAKSAASKAKVRECIRTLNPDVIALQEMGSVSTLLELRGSLQAEGLDFPHWEHVAGAHPDLHIAVLSRYPFSARRPHTQDEFFVGSHQFPVNRGFAEVDVQVTADFSFTLLVAHLKSRRQVPEANADELRIHEAKLLRQKINARLNINTEIKLVVVGDFNDTPDSVAVQTIIGSGTGQLVDTRPAERNGDTEPPFLKERRNISWTNFHSKTDRYERTDYILTSPALSRAWMAEESYVLSVPDWGIASDHRPLMVGIKVPCD